MQLVRNIVRSQGSHLSPIEFKLTRDIAKSEYTIITPASDGKQNKTARTEMKIM